MRARSKESGRLGPMGGFAFLAGVVLLCAPTSAEEKPASGKKPASILEILKIKDGGGAEKKEEPPKEGEGKKKEEGSADAAGTGKAAKKEDAKKDGKEGGDGKEKGAEAKRAEEAMKAEVLKIIQDTQRKKDAKTAETEAIPAGAKDPGAEEKKAEKKEDSPPAKKKEPQPPMFRLRDGTRLAGTPDLKVLNLATPYGRLVVPMSEIVQIRFAAFHDPELAAKVAAGVQALGSEEFDQREDAMAALRKIGPPAMESLRKALQSEDEEVKTRAEKLLSEMEEELSENEGEEGRTGTLAGEDDEVVTLKFTAMGRVEEEMFALATRYGSLKLNRKDIVSIVFQDAPIQRKEFQVPGTSFAAANKWLDTKTNLTQGERLRITATGSISIQNYGQTTGPEGTRHISGNQLEEFPSGALVGRIGDKGKAFLIGPEFQGSANATGKLFLGVSLQNGEVTGQYQVEVELEGGD